MSAGAREHHDLTPEAMAERFGADVLVGSQPWEPSRQPSRSVTTMLAKANEAKREAQREQVRADVDLARDLDKDRQAYAKVIERGEEGTYHEEVRAARYAKAHNLIPPKSSADKHAEHQARRQRQRGAA